MKSTTWARLVAPIAVIVLLGAACGGGDTSNDLEAAAESAPAATVVPTTQPVQVDTGASGAAPEPDATTESDASSDAESPVDPWEVTVLSVNDDVQIVPAFDAPNGNNITLFDINQIDGVELEYPLYAETFFGNRLALVVEQFDDSGAWAEVGIPVRPNGTTAWVQTAFFTEATHNYHITIDLSENTVNVYEGDELLIEQIAASGRETRPTPVVRAYIDEKIPGERVSPAYGAWILSISAFSESLGTFGGGMPKLALHGTNQPELMGQYISSGCVRVPDEVISFIAETVPVGTIIDIVA
jgi:lipoprotein-anchoring transpeptidase ErfK/SrfK